MQTPECGDFNRILDNESMKQININDKEKNYIKDVPERTWKLVRL